VGVDGTVSHHDIFSWKPGATLDLVREVSDRERVAHVLRRLSMGPHPDLIDGLDGTDAAVAAALDLSSRPAPPYDLPVPTRATDLPVGDMIGPLTWWVDQMRSSRRLIEERLVWFWHDHFATSLAKVRVPYMMHRQQLTIRAHATGNFADLLRAMAKDPAMLIYLDGDDNVAGRVNENFGRECLELFTMGIGGGYTQADVVAASRAFTGWRVNKAGRSFTRDDVEFWGSYFRPKKHDDGEKTLLGVTGNFDLDGALDVILDHHSTGRFVASKLYRELVGVAPTDDVAARLGDRFGRDYAIVPLVESIVAEPAFTADETVRNRIRTPVEKLVGLLQAVPESTVDLGRVPRKPRGQRLGAAEALRRVGYLPFAPPNVGGFPDGESLLGPHYLAHAFDLLSAVRASPGPDVSQDVGALFARFGLFDVSERSRDLVERAADPGRRVSLVFASPEYAAV
jgi:uncharacterized protein (DUF1800 family)